MAEYYLHEMNRIMENGRHWKNPVSPFLFQKIV